MPARIMIDKDELMRNPTLEKDARIFCKGIFNHIGSLVLEPKSGYMVPLVVMLSQSKISYSLNFDNEIDLNDVEVIETIIEKKDLF